MTRMPTMLEPGRYYGASKSCRCAGTILSVVGHETARELPEHQHTLPFCCLLLDGKYVEATVEMTVSYEPLTLVYHPANIAHSDHVFPGSRMFTVEICKQWQVLLDECGAPQRSLYTLSGAEPLWIMLRLYELFAADALSDLTVESLVLELIGTFDRLEAPTAAQTAAWLDELRAFLDGHFGESLQVADLARRFDVHPVYLSRSFRHKYKANVGDYVHRRRIQSACRILRSSATSLASIALELGYCDQSHFNRVFLSFTGTTPGRYRRGERGRSGCFRDQEPPT
jgi:AraC-like DNA-binding protein